MIRISLLLLLLLIPTFSQTVRLKVEITEGDQVREVVVRPTGGIIIDLQRGLIRTAINGGLRGVPGQVWVVNQNGDGQAANLKNAEVLYEANESGVIVPVLAFPAPLKVQTSVVCVPVDGAGNVWKVWTTEKVHAVVIYRNGIRQNDKSVKNYLDDVVTERDYAFREETNTIHVNGLWNVNGVNGETKTDTVTADVFYY